MANGLMIDWNAPWLASVRHWGQVADAMVQSGSSVAGALQYTAQAKGVLPGWQFVAQDQLPAGQAYEEFIFQQRCIPTRDNLHDFFNGLIWLHWPVLKQHLNALQAASIAQQGVNHSRGPLRDAITVVDENGALLLAPQALCDALTQRRWQDLCVHQRELWAQAQLLPIGHALLEKLVTPRKAICAHVICVASDSADFEGWDAWLAQRDELKSCNLAKKPYVPLPVLGVPSWCKENQNFSFYDDSLVFRAPRTAQTT